MPDLAWSESAAIPQSCFPSGSSLRRWRPPPHRGGTDQLLQAAFDRERLQVRESFLEGKAPFIQVVPRAPKLQRDLPRGPFAARDNLENLIESPGVMSRQRGHPTRRVREWPTVSGQDEARFVGGHSLQAVEVFVQRVGRALRMKADVRRQLGQHVVAREQQLLAFLIQADMSGRMSRGPFDS